MRRRRSTATARAVTRPTVESTLKLLSCAKVLKMLDIGTVGSLLLKEIVDPAGHQLQMFHLAARHGSGLAKGSNGVGAEVIEGIRHDGDTSADGSFKLWPG